MGSLRSDILDRLHTVCVVMMHGNVRGDGREARVADYPYYG